MTSKKRLFIITAVVVILAVLIILKLTVFQKEVQPTRDRSAGGGRTLDVDVLIVSDATVEGSLRSVGTILPNEEVELVSEVSGRVIKIYFNEGRAVKKGDLLVKINDAELQAQYKKLLSNKKILEDREYRERTLLEKNASTKEIYDAALNELTANKSDLELLKAQIEKTELVAPFYGVTGLRYISEGAYVTPATIIGSLQKTDSVKIDFSLPERYFGIIKHGDRITFSVDGIEGKFNARIYAIEPKIDQLTRSLKSRAIAHNPNGKIPGGAFAQIELPVRQGESSIVLPAEVLTPDVFGYNVYLYKSGKALPKQVRIGYRDEKEVIITEGLQPGDTVIVSGIINLRPNASVKIAEVSGADK